MSYRARWLRHVRSTPPDHLPVYRGWSLRYEHIGPRDAKFWLIEFALIPLDAWPPWVMALR